MSLYHETADILAAPSSTGGNIKTRIFNNKTLKSPPQQVYALALETSKWSSVLKEVIDNSELLRHERKLNPLLALLLVHDLLISRKGIALPASHGLRTSIERHKARLAAELTRARLRRKAVSIDALRQQITIESLGETARYPRWVRLNTLKTTLQDQLDTTFKDFGRATDVKDVINPAGNVLYVDENIPNLLALSPTFEITKAQAYVSGAVILQDKASCFPAYLLDPQPEDGDVIDSCAAPGNKTTHVAAIVNSYVLGDRDCSQKIYAFEKDRHRARTLEKMVKLAGAQEITHISPGQDFLKVDPKAELYRNVGALLLDPSCSGSGIVGRDVMPTIHLPDQPDLVKKPPIDRNRKRKREGNSIAEEEGRQQILVDDDGQEVAIVSEKELKVRLEALSTFQLTLLLHAFKFPAARKVTYSTCSIHAEENEHVVLKALESDVARERGWRMLKRDKQVRGLREWPVRGSIEASGGNEEIAEACIRSYKDDGRGVMGFFVAGFVREVCTNAKETEPIHSDVCGKSPLKGKGRQALLDGNVSSNGAPVLGIPSVMRGSGELDLKSSNTNNSDAESDADEEWGGFTD
ncbi:S-adenosyl-L-methionine-dependent methyltransferase [Xylariaceae sp. FL1651]|nr:S-adenosyl-L-methionine-dependent methyltransferase [Xylariaceae sp. FL1651]